MVEAVWLVLLVVAVVETMKALHGLTTTRPRRAATTTSSRCFMRRSPWDTHDTSQQRKGAEDITSERRPAEGSR